jgi:hypothetical protein
MPGTFNAMSLICRMTASVRSSDAPAGSWAMPIRYCLSGAGTKPEGMRVNRNAVRARSTAYTSIVTDLRWTIRVTPWP